MNNDPFLQIEPNSCSRCGIPLSYHTSGQIKCSARKKPYKLRDGEEVKLGMTVWWYRHHDNTIVKGFVSSIFSWGSLGLRKFPEDRDPGRIFDTSWEGGASAYHSCFSTLKNAEDYKAKEEKRRADLKAWCKKKGHKV